MTFFKMFDIPVFWPILFLYFIALFVLTMKRQIKHMIKYKYVPSLSARRNTLKLRPPIVSSAEPLFVGPGPSCRGSCAGRAKEVSTCRDICHLCVIRGTADRRLDRHDCGGRAAVRSAGAGRRELAFRAVQYKER